MSVSIRLKHSATKDKAPLPTDLGDGELALNTNAASPAAYIKDSAGAVVKLAGAGAVGATDATTTSKGVVQLADAAAVTAGTAGVVVDAAQLKVVADAAAAEDLWDRSGTELTPKNAGDDVFTSGDVKVGGTTAAPRINLKADGSGFFLGNVGINTTSPNGLLSLEASSGRFITLRNATTGTGATDGSYLSLDGKDLHINNTEDADTIFYTSDTERARLDHNGRLLVGTTTARENFFNASTSARLQLEGTNYTESGLAMICNNASSAHFPLLTFAKSNGSSVGSNTLVAKNDNLAYMSFQGNDGSEFVEAVSIKVQVDGTPTADDVPGRLVFSTNRGLPATSAMERMRISANGSAHIGPEAGFHDETLRLQTLDNTNKALVCRTSNTASTSHSMVQFQDGDSDSCGEIIINTAANTTNYSTNSDYRLKENIAAIPDPVARLNALNPCSFNFISSPDFRFDGFIAHEAQAVVPECVTGVKDGVDDEGKPVYQGIDQSKMVPLLTAALQEALQKIKTLEQRLNDAGIA